MFGSSQRSHRELLTHIGYTITNAASYQWHMAIRQWEKPAENNKMHHSVWTCKGKGKGRILL